MIKWFGASWGAPCCEPALHVDTPVGEFCFYCEQPIGADAQGLLVGHWATVDGDHGYVPTPDGAGQEPPVLALVAERPRHLDCWLHELGISDEAIYR